MCPEFGRQVRTTELRDIRIQVIMKTITVESSRKNRVRRRENEAQNFGGNIPLASKNKKLMED